MIIVFVEEDDKLKILHELEQGNEDFNNLLSVFGEEKRANVSNEVEKAKVEDAESTNGEVAPVAVTDVSEEAKQQTLQI